MKLMKVAGAAVCALMMTLVGQTAIAKTLKIGVLAPLSGAAAADGQETVQGVEMAIEEINAAGGVAG